MYKFFKLKPSGESSFAYYVRGRMTARSDQFYQIYYLFNRRKFSLPVNFEHGFFTLEALTFSSADYFMFTKSAGSLPFRSGIVILVAETENIYK